jgi:hypothetical protein
VWFILEFFVTQILKSTTSRFECISGLIKVTDSNDARWKLEPERYTFSAGRCYFTKEDVRLALYNSRLAHAFFSGCGIGKKKTFQQCHFV